MSRVTVGNNGITKDYNVLTHRGVDIGWHAEEKDNQITAHSDGKAVWIQTGQNQNLKATGNKSYGNAIKIKHNNNYYTLYAHLKKVNVKKGDKVKKGQIIGVMGETGKAYGRHLHFEVRNEKDTRINPTKYIYQNLPLSYECYDNVKNKWLPTVYSGSKNYAGNIKHAISGIRLSDGQYRVYDLVKRKWLPSVIGNNDYAGNLSNNIGGVEILGKNFEVHVLNGKWVSSINGICYPEKAIDAIRIK